LQAPATNLIKKPANLFAGFLIEHPMAVVILGGLVTSTALNLFLLPAIYLRYGQAHRG
jgi:Cu/Ag efflux pump CusA